MIKLIKQQGMTQEIIYKFFSELGTVGEIIFSSNGKEGYISNIKNKYGVETETKENYLFLINLIIENNFPDKYIYAFY